MWAQHHETLSFDNPWAAAEAKGMGNREWRRQHDEHEPLQLKTKTAVPDDGLCKDSKHHLSESSYVKQDQHEIQAGMSKHHCTDVMCTVIFLIALAGLGLLLNYAFVEGDLRRLTHGYNFTGHLCGVDAPDKPFLYWCQKPNADRGLLGGGGSPVALDLRHPICVQNCPTTYNTTHICFRNVEKVIHRAKGGHGGGFTVEETTKYVFNRVNDYVSAPYLNRYCLPEDMALKAELMKALNDHPMTKLLMEFSQLSSATVPLSLAVLIAFILGYAYIFVLDKFATCLVYTSIALVILLSTAIGVYLLISEFFGGIDGLPNSGDSQMNFIAGFGLLAVALVFGCFACCAQGQIEVAIGCVQAAADCMFDMPTVLFEPLITLACKIVIVVLLLSGFLLLASVGKVKAMTLEQFASNYELLPGAKVSGVFRTFEYHESQYWYMAYYIFVSVWIFCVITALSQFVIAYAVQLWYFTPIVHAHKDAPSCPLVRGFYIGTSCHLGSLAFGALVVTIFQLVRAVLAILAEAAQHEGNSALTVLAKCCFCCISCFEQFIEFLNKNAYMDIAINSTCFCTAAQNALQVLHSEVAAITVLNGATWVFKIAGYALITSVGTFSVWTMVRSMWWFNNVESPQYIHDPITVCALAAIICFAVSVGFMLVFDMVADTVLYCFATEQRRKQRSLLPRDVQYAPSSLNRLIEKHSDPAGYHDDAHHDDSVGFHADQAYAGYHADAYHDGTAHS